MSEAGRNQTTDNSAGSAAKPALPKGDLHLHQEDAVRELLQIPDSYAQGCLLPVGRLRTGHTFRPARRRPLDEVVAVDCWSGPPL